VQTILQTLPGGIETLYLGQMHAPRPAAQQLLVRVRAAGVNRADVLQREGYYPPPPGAPTILGLEIAGEVVQLGLEVTNFAVGDAVFGLVAGGGYADYALLDSQLAIRKPSDLSWEAAASLPEAWMTALFNLGSIGKLAAGQTVLIHAGASGVGSAAIQMAALKGATVLATVGNAAKADYCRALGANTVINYRAGDDFVEAAKAIGGVDLVLDCVGADYFERNLSSLKSDGMLIVIGGLGGRHAALDLGRLLAKRLTVKGSTLRSQPLAVKEYLSRLLESWVLPAWLAGELTITVDRVFSLGEAAAAHAYLEAGLNQGKVILRVE
jgi:NADPH:quinone reductase